MLSLFLLLKSRQRRIVRPEKWIGAKSAVSGHACLSVDELHFDASWGFWRDGEPVVCTVNGGGAGGVGVDGHGVRWC